MHQTEVNGERQVHSAQTDFTFISEKEKKQMHAHKTQTQLEDLKEENDSITVMTNKTIDKNKKMLLKNYEYSEYKDQTSTSARNKSNSR